MDGVSVAGLGKLGAPIAACLASRGVSVIGVDVDLGTVRAMNESRTELQEPGLDALLAETGGRLRATTDYAEAVRETDATLIFVPTPSNDDGGFALHHVKEAAREIGRALRGKGSYHVVAVNSTVLPGATEDVVLPILEEESGLSCGRDFGLCYNPEFVALGSVIEGFLNPDFVLVGESDPEAGDKLAGLYKRVCDNNPTIARMSFVNAEIAKLAVNTYVTTKITFANTLAAICEQLPGGDIDEVVSAVGLDRRIGSEYLKGALGYGGPCFPRDNVAFSHLACQLGQPAMLAEATEAQNRLIVDRLVSQITSYVPPEGSVAVLGLAYKPDTDVVEESQALQLADRLACEGLSVTVYDPLAMENARRVLGNKVVYGESLDDCLDSASVVVIANPDSEFTSVGQRLLRDGSSPVIVDIWRMLREEFKDGSMPSYRAVGIGPLRAGAGPRGFGRVGGSLTKKSSTVARSSS